MVTAEGAAGRRVVDGELLKVNRTAENQGNLWVGLVLLGYEGRKKKAGMATYGFVKRRHLARKRPVDVRKPTLARVLVHVHDFHVLAGMSNVGVNHLLDFLAVVIAILQSLVVLAELVGAGEDDRVNAVRVGVRGRFAVGAPGDGAGRRRSGKGEAVGGADGVDGTTDGDVETGGGGADGGDVTSSGSVKRRRILAVDNQTTGGTDEGGQGKQGRGDHRGYVELHDEGSG